MGSLSAAARAKRPTPVPAAARKRYEKVFIDNVLQRKKAAEEQRRKKEEDATKSRSNGLLNPNHVTEMSPTRKRRAAGWRGLSVDLITGDPDSVADQLNGVALGSTQKGKAKDDGGGSDTDDDDDLVKVRASIFAKAAQVKAEPVIGKDERLEGSVVKLIWKKSGLEKRRLADIWYVAGLPRPPTHS